jgi:hypothetical protein
LNINSSSGKNIIQVYKKEGRIEKKIYRGKKQSSSSLWTSTKNENEKISGSSDDE